MERTPVTFGPGVFLMSGKKEVNVYMLDYESFYKITGTSQHAEFESHLKKILFKSKERVKFYDEILKIDHDLYRDTFRGYFEQYSAERKSNQQDYTPDEVSLILATLTRSDAEGFRASDYTAYDPTAGTGSLLIQKWKDDQLAENLWSYVPHRYFYRADELADNVIPYLIHNLAIRGMNAVVVHGDVLEGKAKQVYFIQNSRDDFLAYSDVNVMPHSAEVAEEFGIKQWREDEIRHVESGKVAWNYATPMHRKALKINPNPVPGEYTKQEDRLTIGDIATVERSKKNKIYPKGSIIIQISASRGQTGLLTSSGRVADRYAVVEVVAGIDPGFVFYSIQRNIKKHLHKYQTGLNIALNEIKNIPIAVPF